MVKNEDGLVKCLTEKGNIKWIAEHIVVNANQMKKMGLKIAPSPVKLDPHIMEDEQPNDFQNPIINEVAEAKVAKKPRKTKQN